MEALLAADVAVFRWINEGLGTRFLDDVMLAVSSRWTWVIIGVVVAAILIWRQRLGVIRFVVVCGITMGLADFVTYQIIKPAFSRPRPCYALSAVRLVQDGCGGDYGFPSNHAANAMAGAIVLAIYASRRFRPLFFGAAVLVGLSRIYIGVHYPLDVLGGYAVGAFLAAVVITIERKLKIAR